MGRLTGSGPYGFIRPLPRRLESTSPAKAGCGDAFAGLCCFDNCIRFSVIEVLMVAFAAVGTFLMIPVIVLGWIRGWCCVWCVSAVLVLVMYLVWCGDGVMDWSECFLDGLVLDFLVFS
jgi:hypothetical protein